jgi:hypothetical protein
MSAKRTSRSALGLTNALQPGVPPPSAKTAANMASASVPFPGAASTRKAAKYPSVGTGGQVESTHGGAEWVVRTALTPAPLYRDPPLPSAAGTSRATGPVRGGWISVTENAAEPWALTSRSRASSADAGGATSRTLAATGRYSAWPAPRDTSLLVRPEQDSPAYYAGPSAQLLSLSRGGADGSLGTTFTEEDRAAKRLRDEARVERLRRNKDRVEGVYAAAAAKEEAIRDARALKIADERAAYSELLKQSYGTGKRHQ